MVILDDEHKEQITLLNSSTLLGFLDICGNDHMHTWAPVTTSIEVYLKSRDGFLKPVLNL